jgi:hypothetical protein
MERRLRFVPCIAACLLLGVSVHGQTSGPSPGGAASLPSLGQGLGEAAKGTALRTLYESLSQADREKVLGQVDALQFKIPIETQYPIGPVPPKPPPVPPLPPKRNPRLADWDAEFGELRDTLEWAAAKGPTFRLSDDTASEIQRMIGSIKTGTIQARD